MMTTRGIGLRLFAAVGELASVVGLIVSLDLGLQREALHFSGWSYVAIVVAAVLFLYLAWSALSDYRKSRPIRFKLPKERSAIGSFLSKWILENGHCIVFSNNLSWVNTDEIKAALTQKAQQRELSVVVPRTIELTNELQRNGAQVIAYPGAKYTIGTRFTLGHWGRGTVHMILGEQGQKEHKIYRFEGTHPAVGLAVDLFSIIQRLAGEVA